jgi:hypothetical protein
MRGTYPSSPKRLAILPPLIASSTSSAVLHSWKSSEYFSIRLIDTSICSSASIYQLHLRGEEEGLPRTPFVAFIKSGPSISVVHSVKLAISSRSLHCAPSMPLLRAPAVSLNERETHMDQNIPPSRPSLARLRSKWAL